MTGDTKVVDKGKADGIFINTTGVGECYLTGEPDRSRVCSGPGMQFIVSGDLGAHGIAILSVREGLEFEGPVSSDTASSMACRIEALIDVGIEIHCLRDLTRGGLSSALNEIASVAGLCGSRSMKRSSRFRTSYAEPANCSVSIHSTLRMRDGSRSSSLARRCRPHT